MNLDGNISFAVGMTDPSGQFGALCWRMHRGRAQVLLITSRDTGRWIIPKGWPVPTLTAAGSAAQEAWEEAGVEGTVAAAPLGLFSYDKILKPGVTQPCVVTVFTLRVARLRRRFPERKERRRKWFDAATAARKVAEPELRGLLATVAEHPDMLDTQAGLVRP